MSTPPQAAPVSVVRLTACGQQEELAPPLIAVVRAFVSSSPERERVHAPMKTLHARKHPAKRTHLRTGTSASKRRSRRRKHIPKGAVAPLSATQHPLPGTPFCEWCQEAP